MDPRQERYKLAIVISLKTHMILMSLGQLNITLIEAIKKIYRKLKLRLEKGKFNLSENS